MAAEFCISKALHNCLLGLKWQFLARKHTPRALTLKLFLSKSWLIAKLWLGPDFAITFKLYKILVKVS